jgi:hypothetical protein
MVALNSYQAVNGDSILSLLSARAAFRPLVAVLAMWLLYRSSESSMTPRIFAIGLGAIVSPLTITKANALPNLLAV